MNFKKLLERKSYWLVIVSLFIPIIIQSSLYIIRNGFCEIEYLKVIEKILNVISEYKSYYGTVLTMSFTIYSFNETQDRIENERKKEKEKELEEKKDEYRPRFIIDDKNIRLMMRKNDYYLEKVKCYYAGLDKFEIKDSIKAGGKIECDSTMVTAIFITGETQVGEVILFGYYKNGLKFYKYLKQGGNPLVPIDNYNEKSVKENWGDYNTVIENENDSLHEIFFYDTILVREKIQFENISVLKHTLKSKNATEFYKNIFVELAEGYKAKLFDYSCIEIVMMLLQIVEDNHLSFKVNKNDIHFDYLKKQEMKLILNQEKTSQVCEKKFQFPQFIQKVNSLFKKNTQQYSKQYQIKKEIYEALLNMTAEVFRTVKVSREIDKNIVDYKSNILQKIHIK